MGPVYGVEGKSVCFAVSEDFVGDSHFHFLVGVCPLHDGSRNSE